MSGGTLCRIKGVGSGIQMHARTKLDALADADVGCIQHQAVVVSVEVFAQINMAAIVTVIVALYVDRRAGYSVVGTNALRVYAQQDVLVQKD